MSRSLPVIVGPAALVAVAAVALFLPLGSEKGATAQPTQVTSGLGRTWAGP